MKKVLFLLAIVLVTAGCSNNKTETNTIEKRDSSVTKDSVSPTDNSVTPPASNGQF